MLRCFLEGLYYHEIIEPSDQVLGPTLYLQLLNSGFSNMIFRHEYEVPLCTKHIKLTKVAAKPSFKDNLELNLMQNKLSKQMQIQRKLHMLLFSKTFQVTAFLLLKKNIDI